MRTAGRPGQALHPESSARFRGTLNIVRFNWPRYLLGSAMVAAAALAAMLLVDGWVRAALLVMSLLGAGLLVASLVVSHVVYDRSDLYRWEWLADLVPERPIRWANVHMGFDETTLALRRLFAREVCVFDVYDRHATPEASLRRARRIRSPVSAVRAAHGALPLAEGSLDVVFVIFSAHELRSASARSAFFAEVRRVLAPTGRLVLVEHLRDVTNLLAFGPGALHFFSRRDWLSAAEAAGLVFEAERRKAGFVRALAFRC